MMIDSQSRVFRKYLNIIDTYCTEYSTTTTYHLHLVFAQRITNAPAPERPG